ncbi:lysosomal proton-coupled steroid conjugate and bile acid symporter SLC46A3-like isoform X1 [Palaemon carinicauda]|uniref:lysosomal proton-coupled steroid conjugate and bile acid symporter SLC46A3-like isoform X1 n=1 Tax=Palaemon carinicauda TaxID=392227 RepID=UPI0035B5C497
MACTRFSKALRSVKDILRVITIAPMLFLKAVSSAASLAPAENLKLERYCRVTLGYPGDICEKINDGNHESIQVEVQKRVNIFNFNEKLISSIIPVLLLSFIASWSDQRGRRLPILLSIFGTTLYSATYLLVSFFPTWPPEILYVASFCLSFGGGWSLFYMAVYSYIADMSACEDRTKRLAIVRSIWVLGTPAGTAVGALIYDAGGFCWVFGFSTVLYLSSFFYSVFVVKDKEKLIEENKEISKQKRLWNPRNVVDLFHVCLRKRQGSGRWHIMILLGIMLMHMSASPHNLYLWLLRVLNWDIDSYSIYKIVDDVGTSLATLCFTPIFGYLRLHDCSVGGMTLVLLFCRSLAFGMTTSPSQWWVPYVFIFIPEEYGSVTIRSRLSKICDENETGRVFAMLAVLEVFWPIADSAIFTGVYGATIENYPSFEHLVGAAFALLAIMGFLGLRLSLNNDEIQALKKKIDAEQGRYQTKISAAERS